MDGVAGNMVQYLKLLEQSEIETRIRGHRASVVAAARRSLRYDRRAAKDRHLRGRLDDDAVARGGRPHGPGHAFTLYRRCGDVELAGADVAKCLTGRRDSDLVPF